MAWHHKGLLYLSTVPLYTPTRSASAVSWPKQRQSHSSWQRVQRSAASSLSRRDASRHSLWATLRFVGSVGCFCYCCCCRVSSYASLPHFGCKSHFRCMQPTRERGREREAHSYEIVGNLCIFSDHVVARHAWVVLPPPNHAWNSPLIVTCFVLFWFWTFLHFMLFYLALLQGVLAASRWFLLQLE